MEKIRIIYTPNADKFRLGDFGMFGDRYINDPELTNLRRNYSALKNRFPDLPSNVGIATFFSRLKQLSRERFQNVENQTTNYVPLDILKKILDLRKEDAENPLTREYVYRAITDLVSNPSICLDPSLCFRKEVMFVMNSLFLKKAIGALEEVSDKIKEKAGEVNAVKALKEARDCVDKIFPKFEDTEKVYEEVRKRFEANKVSIDFPLYYLPKGHLSPYLFSVSLEEHIERDPIIDKILGCVEVGCKSVGMAEIPKEIRQQVERLQKDRFGKTKMLCSLEDLLGSLAEPKTLITDIYVVDHFPELSENELETCEFKLFF